MIGLLIVGALVVFFGVKHLSSIQRMRSVRLKDPKEANGRPVMIPYQNPIATFLSFAGRIMTGNKTPDFELFPKFAKDWENKSHSVQMFFFGVPVLVTWDPQIIREVSSNDEVFHKVNIFNVVLDRLAGEGVLMVAGDRWSRQRRVMNPSFRITKLKSIFPAFIHASHLLINAILPEIYESNGNVKLFPLLTKMTMEAIGKAGFGFEFGSFEKEAALELKSYQFIMNKMADPKSFSSLMSKLPTKENKKLDESFKTFRKLVTDLIARKRSMPKRDGDESDLLEMLISANEEGVQMTDEELIHNVNTFFIAGHETTSSALLSTIYLIAKNTEVQDRARSEAIAVLHGADPTYEDVSHLNFIAAVIREAARLYPPLMGFSRQSVQDCVVNGYYVPKGTVFSMLSIALHTSEEFYDAPYEFRPDRWIKENETDKAKSAPWYPFGAGPRICIGNNFAMLEMKAVLAMLLQKFKFSPMSELKFQQSITLKPVDSFTINVQSL